MNTEKQTLKIELDLDSVHQAMNNITGQSIGDATVVMVQQRAKGIAKYGVTIEESGLSVEELVRHAQEEAADASVYLAQAVRVLKRHDAEIKNGLDQSYSRGVSEGIRMLFNAFDNYLTKDNPSDVREVFVYLRNYCKESGVNVDSPTPGVQSIHRGPDVLLAKPGGEA